MQSTTESPVRLAQAANDRLMTEAEVEAYFGWRPGVISRMRSRGDKTLPPFIRVSARSIRYRRAAVEAFLNARTVNPQESR